MIWLLVIVAGFAWTFAKLGALFLMVRVLTLGLTVTIGLIIAGFLYRMAKALLRHFRGTGAQAHAGD